jgi:hypothetical protein
MPRQYVQAFVANLQSPHPASLWIIPGASNHPRHPSHSGSRDETHAARDPHCNLSDDTWLLSGFRLSDGTFTVDDLANCDVPGAQSAALLTCDSVQDDVQHPMTGSPIAGALRLLRLGTRHHAEQQADHILYSQSSGSDHLSLPQTPGQSPDEPLLFHSVRPRPTGIRRSDRRAPTGGR